MAIYDIFTIDRQTNDPEYDLPLEVKVAVEAPPVLKEKGRFFSSLAARVFFFLLLLADVCWAAYTLILLLLYAGAHLVTGRKATRLGESIQKRWIALRRSLVCGLSLFIALFSPSFGIMVACTYFLMYDKSGIEEVVPSSLQAQFKEFLPKE
jgi:hypothetical protein